MKSKWQDYKNSAEKALSEGKYEFAESLWYAALEEAMDFDATDRRRALCMERLCECLWFQQKFDDQLWTNIRNFVVNLKMLFNIFMK